MSDFYGAKKLAVERATGAAPPEDLLRERYDGLSVESEPSDGVVVVVRVPWRHVDHGSDLTVSMDLETGGLDEFISGNIEVEEP